MSSIRLHFEPNLDYQLQAIEAVCALFEGTKNVEEKHSANTSLLENLALVDSHNSTTLSSGEMLRNLQRVQERNGIAKSTELRPNEWHFTVEMETGTGKTYVYLRTILELNYRYGFNKFIIVVPSVAIKEGVDKSIINMAKHFSTLYKKKVGIKSFVYLSDRMGELKNFANDGLEVMISTVQSLFENESRIRLHQEDERTFGLKPVELIRRCRPIVIVDEPQKIGDSGENAIAALHPLCTLRYSATHRNPFHAIYKLDAVEASQKKLVKGIEVASVQADLALAGCYVELVRTLKKRGGCAKIKMWKLTAGGSWKLAQFEVCPKDELSHITNFPGVYDHVVVQEVHQDYIRLSNRSEPLYVGESTCDISEEVITRAMIRTTIMEHARKELRLRPKGIKVLSLFFIDHVKDYRLYDADNNPLPGKLATMFEEEYKRVMEMGEFSSLFGQNPPAPEVVHNGYFSIDKDNKSKWVDTREGTRNSLSAELAYKLILRDKERLLSLDEPLKFIFSHSLLREGWDNPNVFQVCVLRDMKNNISRRQALGRGLRLCVNQEGMRVREEGVNILTVVAREGFRDYADALQREYEADGLRFGVITKEWLGTLEYTDENGERALLGQENAGELIDDLRDKGLLIGDRPTEELKRQLDAGTYRVPEAFKQAQAQIIAKLKSLTRSLEIKDVRARKKVSYPKMVGNDAFRELWERIKQKTVYSISFETDTLVQNTVDVLKRELRKINRPMVLVAHADVVPEEGGVHAEQTKIEQELVETTSNKPSSDDLLGVLRILEAANHLTRRTLARILSGCGEELLQRICYNGSKFTQIVQQVIAAELRKILVKGVAYHPVLIGATEYNAQEIFRDTGGYLDRLLKTGNKCPADYVEFDSEVERRFAEDAEASSEVKLYVKLPRSFTVPTPLGAYNPDWALVLEVNGKNHLYFVVETKSTDMLGELRDIEQGKIKCAEKHFDSIAGTHTMPARYLAPVENLSDVIARAQDQS